MTMFFVCCSSDGGMQAETLQTENDMTMYITIAGQTQSITLAKNAATQELVERLQNGAVTVTLNSSGGFEIWGPLGFSLPTSNQQMTAQPGDVVLYNGSNICLFYGSLMELHPPGQDRRFVGKPVTHIPESRREQHHRHPLAHVRCDRHQQYKQREPEHHRY